MRADDRPVIFEKNPDEYDPPSWEYTSWLEGPDVVPITPQLNWLRTREVHQALSAWAAKTGGRPPRRLSGPRRFPKPPGQMRLI